MAKKPDQRIRELAQKVGKKKNAAKLEWDTLEEFFVIVQECVMEEKGPPDEQSKSINKKYEMLLSLIYTCMFIARKIDKKRK